MILIDGTRIKIRDGHVSNRTVYVAMGINMDGERDVLGLWVGPTGGESAKYWLGVLTELRNRGVNDVLVLCCYAEVVVMPMRSRGEVSAAGSELRLSA